MSESSTMFTVILFTTSISEVRPCTEIFGAFAFSPVRVFVHWVSPNHETTRR